MELSKIGIFTSERSGVLAPACLIWKQQFPTEYVSFWSELITEFSLLEVKISHYIIENICDRKHCLKTSERHSYGEYHICRN